MSTSVWVKCGLKYMIACCSYNDTVNSFFKIRILDFEFLHFVLVSDRLRLIIRPFQKHIRQMSLDTIAANTI